MDANIPQLAVSKLQTCYELLPLFLKRRHVGFAKSLHKRLVAGWIVSLVGDELVIELREFTMFLQIVAQVTSLGVVRAFVVAVEFAVGRAGELFERRHRAGLDRALQPRQPPVRVADDVAITFAGLFVEQAQTLAKP